ncbi:Pancreatic lipase-related protein 2-like protein [Leptotrombidium deliense]|uniref:Pancreatic lipase-related protein 2-like protein n=1 Tax=Leptotrombidium deliense TaxID=299467 RepID=A0A443SLB9_9ACAR|nr:Pancreatic lipase-related protein 2-like protein [Leptotrombidium deliense]
MLLKILCCNFFVLLSLISVANSAVLKPIGLLSDTLSKIDVLNIHNALTHKGEENGSETGQFEGNEICYGVLGCFGRMDFYSPLHRPIALLPQSPEAMDVTFNLYTNKNKFVPNVLTYDLKKEQIDATFFDPSKPTKFIIHGFHGSYNDMQWMGDIKDLLFLLDADRFNVLGVDWSKGASSLFYNQAASNTRVVGAAIAYFINKLVEFKGANVTNMHLIGHSLGSHVSGYAGERFQTEKLGRITGLDPAGPAFQKDAPTSRLDPSDASYVDILHTDAGDSIVEGFGLKDSIGDTDFYPNGGSRQPNCGITKGIFNLLEYGIGEGISNTIACNHQRAWQMALVNQENLEENCQFVGYECDSFSDFVNGKCYECGDDGSKCTFFSLIGEYDPRYGHFFKRQQDRALTNKGGKRKFFLQTNGETPYCCGIAVYFEESMPRSATGKILLDLVGSRRSVEDVSLTENFSSFYPGGLTSTLITYTKTLGAVELIKFRYNFGGLQYLDPTKLISPPKLRVSKIKVNYLSNIDPRIRERFSTVLCRSSNSDIRHGEQVIFEKCEK